MHYFEYYKVLTKEDREYEVLAKMISISRRGVCPFCFKRCCPSTYCTGLYSDTLSVVHSRQHVLQLQLHRLHCTRTDTRLQTKWFFTSFIHGFYIPDYNWLL
jgi:hypothetical protein